MMVGSLESDIEDVCNQSYDNNDVIDDFDDILDDKNVPIANYGVSFYI